MAFILLNEDVKPIQWFGIVLIIIAIVIMNVNFTQTVIILLFDYKKNSTFVTFSHELPWHLYLMLFIH
jgi:hypothetical protein